jgi:hypothetical protein
MKRAWLVWAVTTLLMAAYVGAAFIEAHATVGQLELTPGKTLTLKSFNLFERHPRFILDFKAKGCEQRPELGRWEKLQSDPGFIRLRPGADVRIEASTGSAGPVLYEAMPTNAYCSDGNSRGLTANLSVEPGLWRWPPPPDTPSIRLPPGFNEIHLKVVAVDQRIAGETVKMVMPSALGLNQYPLGMGWLWFAYILGPIFCFSQPIWAMVLAWKTFEAG